jgi:Xaa-Pro aminopeptidase
VRQLIDATALVNWQRLVKSDEEIEFHPQGGRISEKDHHHRSGTRQTGAAQK